MVGAVIIADPEGRGYEFAKGVFEYVSKKEGRDFPVELVHLKRTTFRDGEFKVKIEKNVRKHNCFIIHDPNKEAGRWVADLLFSLKAAASSSPQEIRVVFPYFKFARQDRKDESRVGVSAKAVCDILSLYADGALSVDLHAPQIQEYARSNFPFDNLSSAPVVAAYLARNRPSLLSSLLSNLTLVSPDLGGGKRLETYQKALEKRGISVGLALGHKTRARENVVEKVVIIGDVAGKNCLIVDDIIDTGDTMIKTCEKLKGSATKIFAYGTFGLFSDGMGKFESFDGVMTSDAVNLGYRSNVEIISLVDLFGEAVYRSHIGDSLSDLFN
ncbi:MAG: ribose-phosphate diphosphokinase [Nanoarchaeota archaeon]|nr:ribose-phosphate diphosphokinase [Nanoarchaeota archaeon]MBU0978151.1 ribose-phosphate diphosphokinase [Nanoarchaeota archaeon]